MQRLKATLFALAVLAIFYKSCESLGKLITAGGNPDLVKHTERIYTYSCFIRYALLEGLLITPHSRAQQPDYARSVARKLIRRFEQAEGLDSLMTTYLTQQALRRGRTPGEVEVFWLICK